MTKNLSQNRIISTNPQPILNHVGPISSLPAAARHCCGKHSSSRANDEAVFVQKKNTGQWPVLW